MVGIFWIQSLNRRKLEDTDRMETGNHNRSSSSAMDCKEKISGKMHSCGSRWKQFTSNAMLGRNVQSQPNAHDRDGGA